MPVAGTRRAPGRADAATTGALLLAAALATPAGSLRAQEPPAEGPRVLGARLEATIPEAPGGGDGPAGATRIEIAYRVASDTPVAEIPLRSIQFFGTRLHGVEAATEGRGARLEMDTGQGTVVTGRLRLDRPLAAGDTLTVGLAYRLDRAIPGRSRSFDLVLPLLMVDWPPAGAPDDMLEAAVSIPASYSVLESFPTVPKEMSTSGERRRYDFRLQVIPSMVRFRGQVGEPPVLTFSRLVDLGVFALLLAAAAIGYWGLRRGQS